MKTVWAIVAIAAVLGMASCVELTRLPPNSTPLPQVAAEWNTSAKLGPEGNPTHGPGHKELSSNIRTIAFASCNRAHLEQPAWRSIMALKPELFVWLGDVVYTDKKQFRPSRDGARFLPRELPERLAKYEELLDVPDYRQLVSQVPVVGVWDDHDYGINNGGKHFGERNQSQQLFMDFLGEPAASPLRSRPGIYRSFTFGSQYPVVQLILLDNRYFRDNRTSYHPSPTGDVLGEEQWAWLEQELEQSTADVVLVGSGIQVLITDRLPGESWAEFPAARRRLLRLLAQHYERSHARIALLSGDIHWSEMHQECLGRYLHADDEGEELPARDSEQAHSMPPIIEVTSSGLTHACGDTLPLRSCKPLFRIFYPRSESHLLHPPRYMDRNFGVVHITEHDLTLEVRDVQGGVRLQYTMPLSGPLGAGGERREDSWQPHMRCPRIDVARWKLGAALTKLALLVCAVGAIVAYVVKLLCCGRKQKQRGKPHAE